MKYAPHVYAKALAEVTLAAKKGEEAKVVSRFLALVRKNGDEVHLRKIVEEAARFVRGAQSIRKVTVGIARPLTTAQKKLLKEFIDEGDVVEERIDPALVAGLRLIVDDEMQFDGTLKGKLDKMFT
jgi:F0F1-type ATP synthase delta subunit